MKLLKDVFESTFKNVPENYAKLKQLKQVTEAYYCNNNCNESVECLKCWVDKGKRTASAGVVDVSNRTLLPSAAMSWLSQFSIEAVQRGRVLCGDYMQQTSLK